MPPVKAGEEAVEKDTDWEVPESKLADMELVTLCP